VRRLLALGAVALLAGCTSPASATFHPSPAGSASATTPASAPPPPAASSTGPLTLAFAGDVHFTGRTAPLLANLATAFGPITSTLSSADLTMVNLETAVTDRGSEEPKQYHFRAPISAFEAVRAAGVDVVTMANNHVLDYGQVGIADTLQNATAARFPYVGIGRDAAAAFAPYFTTVKGVKIGIVAFSQVHELEYSWAARDNRPGVAMAGDLARAVAAVRAARAAADLVIVFNHWGQEGNACPTAEQKTFAARLAGAGADVIIGSHAHTLQGDGWLGKTYVAYGMANFLWYGDSFSTETGVLRLTMSGRRVVKNEFLPAVVSSTGQPTPLTGPAAAALTTRYAGLRGCAGLAPVP
jgi:poly-gamma-glutamate capsule biosynthesis protein CapA/YwtB (metallophosphatase superfamily)